MKDEETANAHVQMRLEEVAAKQVAPVISEPSTRGDEVTATRLKRAVAAILLVLFAASLVLIGSDAVADEVDPRANITTLLGTTIREKS